MSRPALLALFTLLAAPVAALETGTYPVTLPDGVEGEGRLEVSSSFLEVFITGPGGCNAVGGGTLLKGPDGAWAALLNTDDAAGRQCVLVGTSAGFSPVGEGCATLVTGSCQLAGSISAPAPQPVRVIRAILEGQFNRLDEAGRRGVQALLAERGHYTGQIDGVYGDGTEAALIALLQEMADRGETVDGNSTSAIRGLMRGISEEGIALSPPAVKPAAPAAAPAAGAADPIFVGRWSCGGDTYVFTADRYQIINEYDRSVIQEGRLRPDGVDGRTAYLELVGYGNLTFAGVGTPDMIMHDPSNSETWDCVRR